MHNGKKLKFVYNSEIISEKTSDFKNATFYYNKTYLDLSTINSNSIERVKMTMKGTQWMLKIGSDKIYQDVLAVNIRG